MHDVIGICSFISPYYQQEYEDDKPKKHKYLPVDCLTHLRREEGWKQQRAKHINWLKSFQRKRNAYTFRANPAPRPHMHTPPTSLSPSSLCPLSFFNSFFVISIFSLTPSFRPSASIPPSVDGVPLNESSFPLQRSPSNSEPTWETSRFLFFPLSSLSLFFS